MLLDAFYLVLVAVTAPWWIRTPRHGWRERFGRITPLPDASRPRLLIHAVSVGEVNLTRRLVSRLAEHAEVVVSVTTDTGIARARELFSGAPGVCVARSPLDASWVVRRFLDAVRPDAVGLVELELWPNFARACRRRGIPLAILNGRLSERSFGRYRLARPILGRGFASLAFVAAQDEVYRERFIAVGARADRCVTLGSMKWDSAGVADMVPGAEALADDLGVDRARPLIVAGSTAPDEHRLLHDATPEGAQLLCAPRRPEWSDRAATDLPGCVRRSAGRGARRQGADRFLLDTIGELRAAYSLADVVVVGRSFGDLFGSDPMEPAALGKPVVIGPSVADFATAVRAMQDADAIIQTSRERLPAVLAELIEHPARRAELGARARACVLAHRGATDRHAARMLSLVGVDFDADNADGAVAVGPAPSAHHGETHHA